MADDHATIWDEFKDAVNMTPAALRKHLDSEESQEVGQKKGFQINLRATYRPVQHGAFLKQSKVKPDMERPCCPTPSV